MGPPFDQLLPTSLFLASLEITFLCVQIVNCIGLCCFKKINFWPRDVGIKRSDYCSPFLPTSDVPTSLKNVISVCKFLIALAFAGQPFAVGWLHGLRTPNEAFFHWNPKLLALGRQIRQINSGAFGGIFVKTIRAHFGTVSLLSMFSIMQSLFLQKLGLNKLVHVVRQFSSMDDLTKVQYFFKFHFQFSGPWDAHR